METKCCGTCKYRGVDCSDAFEGVEYFLCMVQPHLVCQLDGPCVKYRRGGKR